MSRACELLARPDEVSGCMRTRRSWKWPITRWSPKSNGTANRLARPDGVDLRYGLLCAGLSQGFRAQISYFSPTWTAFQSDRGRRFSGIVDDGGWRAGECLTGRQWSVFAMSIRDAAGRRSAVQVVNIAIAGQRAEAQRQTRTQRNLVAAERSIADFIVALCIGVQLHSKVGRLPPTVSTHKSAITQPVSRANRT